MSLITDANRDAYQMKARAILYPDLRARYIEDTLMVDLLANTLAQIDHLARRGFETAQTMPPGRAPSAGNVKVVHELPSQQFAPR